MPKFVAEKKLDFPCENQRGALHDINVFYNGCFDLIGQSLVIPVKERAIQEAS